MRRLVLASLSVLALVACDDKKPSSSGSSPTAAPVPSGSVPVVNAKLGCLPGADGGNVIAGAPADGPLTLTASRGKAQLAVKDARITLDGEGKPQGAFEPFDAGAPPARPALDAPAAGETFDLVTVARGATWTAVVWRAQKPGATPELRAAHFGDDGKRVGPPVVFTKGIVDAPGIAFEGDILHVIWPERASDGAPFRLRWAKWFGKGAISETQYLSTRGESATQPVLAVQPKGLFLVAWTDGDATHTVVKAGASRYSLLHAVTNADEVGAGPGKSHDPAVALEGPKSWVAWRDDKGTARATTLRCIE